MNRREFSATLAIAAAAGIVRPRALFGTGQQATVFDWRPINDSMRVAFGAGGNVMAVAGGGRTLLVDTKNPGYGGVLRAEAESFGGPLERVINTHHHGDHIGGNPFFTGEVPVIGQARGVARATASGTSTLEGIREDPIARLERMNQQLRDMEISGAAKNEGSKSMADFIAMADDIDGRAFAATETFDTEFEVRIGSTVIELRHIGRAHTDNDTVCIPGHGEIGDVHGLQGFHDYFDILRAFVGKEIDAGRSRDQITGMQPPEFRDWSPRRLDQNLGIVYDELTSG
jgi:glyoxylase-like metal-dependent hydrolase (beta-lactamase superfamily II)